MARNLSVTEALKFFHDIPSDASDGEFLDSDANEIEDIIQTAQTDSHPAPSRIQDAMDAAQPCNESSASDEDDESPSEVIVATDEDIVSRDGSRWPILDPSQSFQGRVQKQNVVKIRPGRTAYSVSRVNLNDPLSFLQIFINVPMFRNMRKCTETETQRVTKKPNWTISLDDLEKPIGLIIAQKAIGGRNLLIKSMIDSVWGCPLFNSTMLRNKFLEIMRYLRFDLKSERRTNLKQYKFCLASSIWISFVENCQKAYISNVSITVDKQLLPCKARCKFIQYMANEPDKFGLKFWMAVDVESKYCYNGFTYLGKKRCQK